MISYERFLDALSKITFGRIIFIIGVKRKYFPDTLNNPNHLPRPKISIFVFQFQCSFCDQPLADEPCVRLTCYHVFHWVCLDKWARSLGNDTAPAGYTCQICNECIFPPENLVSPVADALRQTLAEVNWARAGLGMPLLEGNNEKKPQFSYPVGPRPPPEGQSSTLVSSHKDGAIPKYSR